jgi:hypothetical protein
MIEQNLDKYYIVIIFKIINILMPLNSISVKNNCFKISDHFSKISDNFSKISHHYSKITEFFSLHDCLDEAGQMLLDWCRLPPHISKPRLLSEIDVDCTHTSPNRVYCRRRAISLSTSECPEMGEITDLETRWSDYGREPCQHQVEIRRQHRGDYRWLDGSNQAPYQ